MIGVKTIGSGSSGNCYLVTINGTKILLEAGLPFKKIQKALNFKTREIDACFITHEHQDHSKACKDLMNVGIDVFMTAGTCEALDLHGHRLRILQRVQGLIVYKRAFLGSIEILPFRAIHDAKEPVSFFIKDTRTDESLVFITDTLYSEYKIPDVNIIMIECNYIKDIMDKKVLDGKISINLRNRIVKNHMSLETLKSLLQDTEFTKLRKIYLLHLSNSNSDENRIKEEVQKLTGVEVEVC